MKVLFVCDWDFTLIWEKVALILKEKSKISKATAFVVGRIYEKHLHESKNNPFDKLYLLQDSIDNNLKVKNLDEKLKSLENKYAVPNLHRFLWADRKLPYKDYKESCNLIAKSFYFWEETLEYEKPDLIAAVGYGSLTHMVSHFVARRMGIPILRPIHTRIWNRYFPSYDLSGFKSCEYLKSENINYEKAPLSSIRLFIEDYRKNAMRPDYELNFDKTHGLEIGHLYRFFRYIYRFYFSGTYSNDKSKVNPIKKLISVIKPKIKRRFLKIYYKWDQFNSEKNYAYFPLHYQPEATTLCDAHYYLNQISLIENLAKSLPIGFTLVVKEHPQMLGNRDIEYYEKIKQIGNVSLISPFEDNFKVISHASIIFTITGTAGLEALLFKKPVITFGDVFYNQCDLVIKAANIAPTKWTFLINDILSNYTHEESELENFLSLLFNSSDEFSFEEPYLESGAGAHVIESDNIRKITNWIEVELIKVSSCDKYGRMTI
tara:strand:- start:25390 stop:26856 length:1467 start_codon:yes stop_codon:yes gene_type:complete